MFEIEFRTKFGKEKYEALKEYLETHAENLGADDKDCYYYIFPDKLLKVVHNTSQKTAKISLKLNRIGEGAVFPETEIFFSPDDFETMHHLVDNLGLPAKVMHGPQQRVNYQYHDCEIALKWSDAWGYHMEIEQVIATKEKQKEAEAQIHKVADELGVVLMSEDELKRFTKEAERDK